MGKSFYSKIVGVTFGDAQSYIKYLQPGQILRVVREPNNPYDNNAIAIYDWMRPLGHLSRQIAASIAPEIDAGAIYKVTVSEVTGGGEYSYGVNIFIEELGKYVFPPGRLEDLIKTKYYDFSMNQEEYLKDKRARKAAIDAAIIFGPHYNAVKELLCLETEYRSLDALAACAEFMGDFETAYYLRLKIKAEYGVHDVDHNENNVELDRLEKIGVISILKEYEDCKLNNNDYYIEQSRELENELYPEVIEATKFFSRFGDDVEKALNAINQLLAGRNLQDTIKGNAYIAQMFFETGDFRSSAISYVKAARAARNNAVYYAYAGNTAGKVVMELISTGEDKAEDVLQIIHALILERRAINLDYNNARWHFYAGILLHMEANLMAKYYSLEYAKKVLQASKDEYHLALALLNDVNKIIYPSIQQALDFNKQFEDNLNALIG